MAEDEHYSVIFNSINVEGIEINSGIFVGDNYQPMWSAHSKNNTTIANTFGRNYINKPFNLIVDNDYIDYLTHNQKDKNDGS